jgi:four helix bundle protein
MEEETQGYKLLLAWQRAVELVPQIYRLTKKFPSDELYGLTSQLRRAAVSVPANIAEGQGRRSPKEFSHFLSIARGSLAEVDTLLIVAFKLGYVDSVSARKFEPQIIRIRQLLQKLMQSLWRPNEGGRSVQGRSLTPDARRPTSDERNRPQC